MDEWGIALVGLGGALIGAIVGFIGLLWQHNAQVWHDIRKNAADLLVKGISIQQAFDSVANPARGTNTTSVEATAADSRAMHAIVAYLELVADRKTYHACWAFYSACDGMQSLHATLVADKDAVWGPGWNQTSVEWIDAKNVMLERVQANRPRGMSLRYRWKNYRSLKRYERNNPQV